MSEYTLKLQNVTKIFEDAQKGKIVAVDDVSFDVTNPQQRLAFSVETQIGVNLQEEAIHILSAR